MKNTEKQEKLFNSTDYEMALNRAYEFIKSKGLEREYKTQLDSVESSIIKEIDNINNYTGF